MQKELVPLIAFRVALLLTAGCGMSEEEARQNRLMKRLNEKREMEGASPSPRQTAPLAEPASSSERAASQPAERPGDGGEDVAWVQRTLNELGHDCGIADGMMGSNTRSCIRSFQEANGLDITGKINEDTYEMMLERR